MKREFKKYVLGLIKNNPDCIRREIKNLWDDLNIIPVSISHESWDIVNIIIYLPNQVDGLIKVKGGIAIDNQYLQINSIKDAIDLLKKDGTELIISSVSFN